MEKLKGNKSLKVGESRTMKRYRDLIDRMSQKRRFDELNRDVLKPISITVPKDAIRNDRLEALRVRALNGEAVNAVDHDLNKMMEWRRSDVNIPYLYAYRAGSCLVIDILDYKLKRISTKTIPGHPGPREIYYAVLDMIQGTPCSHQDELIEEFAVFVRELGDGVLAKIDAALAPPRKARDQL